MNTYERSCERKRPHSSKGKAKAAITRMKRYFPGDYSDYRPYKCHYCGNWHIGHNQRLTTLVTLAKRMAA